MAIKKAVNQDYITGEHKAILPVNEANRVFIDNFVSLNYERLNQLFDKARNRVNSSANGSTDILNDTLLSVYTDQKLVLRTQEEADGHLARMFAPKAFRNNAGHKNKRGDHLKQ